MKTALQRHLSSIGASRSMLDWIGNRTARQAWEESSDPCWLLRWATKTDVNSPGAIRLAACDCARTVLHLVPAWENRPRLAIEAAERFAVDPSPENLKAMDAAGTAAFFAAWNDPSTQSRVSKNAAVWTAWTVEDAAEGAVRRAEFASLAEQSGPPARNLCSIIRKRLVIPWTEEGQP